MSRLNKVLYSAKTHTTGGRDGASRTDDGRLDIQLSSPSTSDTGAKYESSFDSGEPERYRMDVPNAEVHVLDGGHFALDTAADEMAALVRAFVTSFGGSLQVRRAG